MSESADPAQAGTPSSESSHPASLHNAGSERSFFGHPWQLFPIFGVEMWERFSFYGLQAILAFYLYYSVTEGGLGLDEADALSIVGAYGGLVYLSSVLGAWLSDRVLSAERALLYSGVVVMAGHISLAIFPGIVGVATGLTLIGVGSGTLKTTSQVVLGTLYDREDPRRDGGFSIYYIGVNIGGLLGPLVTNFIWGRTGFHWGFAAAAVMMALGLIQYLIQRRSVADRVGHEVANPLPRSQYLPFFGGAAAVIVGVAVVFGMGVVAVDRIADVVAIVTLLIAIALWTQMMRSDKLAAEERSRLVGFVPMFVASALFWALFQQQFTVLAVYSDQRLNRNILGVEVGPGMVQSINPLFIIIFAGIFAALWTTLGRRQPSYPVKFGLSLIIMGSAWLVFLPFVGGGANSTPFLAIVLILFMFTLAELLLSPVGNSLATRLAPEAFPTRMMALWLLSIALGTALSGTMAGFYDADNPATERVYLLSIFVASIVVGVAVIAMKGWILRKFVDIR